MENIERPQEVSKAQKQIMTEKNQQKYDQDQFQNIYNYLDKLNGLLYPVGSIYISVNNTNPATLFGGEWEQIKDRFLLSAGDTYTVGNTGGEATHTLTTNEMPAHNHQLMSQDNSSSGGGSYNNWHAEFKFANNTNVINTQSGTNKVVTASGPTTGGGQAHNNMPPYLVVYVWKRVN